MSIFDDIEDDSEGEKGGSGGKTGQQVDFRIKVETSRDDLLAPTELNHLQKVKADSHIAQVQKQRKLRKDRSDLKEGKKNLVGSLASGFVSGVKSLVKKHKILSEKPQFDGSTDHQINALPSELDAETNKELQEKLENRLTHRLQPSRRYEPPRPQRS